MSTSNNDDSGDGLGALLKGAGLFAVAAAAWGVLNNMSASSEALERSSKVQVRFERAIAHAQQAETQQAVQLFSEILKIAPSHAPTYNQLAWIYATSYSFDQALIFANKAVEFATNLFDEVNSITTLGDIYYMMGTSNFNQLRLLSNALAQYEASESLYREAIRLAGSHDLFQLPLIKLSNCLNSKGAVFDSFEDCPKSVESFQLSYQVYQYNPYPAINLACISSRLQNKQQMRYWLEIGVPLVIDSFYWQSSHLVSVMLNDLDFENYRDEVLDLLVGHGKITQLEYRRYLESWLRRKHNPQSNRDFRGAIFVNYAEQVDGEQVGTQHR